MVEGGVGVESEGTIMDICPDCDGQGALECEQCGTLGMGDECSTCNGLGEIETKEIDNG